MKKVLVALGVLTGLLLLAAVAVALFLDMNAYKPRIERVVSDALGMEFRIQGKAGLRILPPAGVSLEDIRLRNRGSDLAKFGSVRVGVALRPLLHKQLVITELVLVDPVLRIEKGADGKYNFETTRPGKAPEPKGKEGVPLSVAKAEVKNGGFVYLDRIKGGKTEVAGMDLVLKEFSLPADPTVPPAKGIRFTGELKVKEVKTAAAALRDVKGTVAASGGVYDIRPLSMKVFGGTGEGAVRIDLSKQEPSLRVDFRLNGFRAEESLASVSKEKRFSGPLDLSMNLSMSGNSAARIQRTLNGTVSLQGAGLTIHGMDLDDALSTVSAAQQLDLANLGANLLALPLGVAEKGFGLSGTADRGKETPVSKLVSDWAVRNGVANARDVAFATRRNRIALKGKLDFPNQRFADVTVAVLDPKGCVRIRQGISGPFRKPQMDKVSALQSAVLKPVIDLFGKAKTLAGAKDACEPFYAGSVPHPR